MCVFVFPFSHPPSEETPRDPVDPMSIKLITWNKETIPAPSTPAQCRGYTGGSGSNSMAETYSGRERTLDTHQTHTRHTPDTHQPRACASPPTHPDNSTTVVMSDLYSQFDDCYPECSRVSLQRHTSQHRLKLPTLSSTNFTTTGTCQRPRPAMSFAASWLGSSGRKEYKTLH